MVMPNERWFTTFTTTRSPCRTCRVGPGAIPLKVQEGILTPESKVMMVFCATRVNCCILGAVKGACKLVIDFGAPGIPMLTEVGTPAPAGSCGAGKKLVLGAGDGDEFPLGRSDITAPATRSTASTSRVVANTFLPSPGPPGVCCVATGFCICF